MKLIILGAPGAGKGSHAKLISKDYNIPQISMGDIIRKQITEETSIGKQVEKIISKGELVSDEIVIELLKQRLKKKDCEKGYILDGFPRTIVQANSLEKITDIDNVIALETTEETIIQRLSGRRTCKECGRIFHITNMPPEEEGKCDGCDGELFQRKDDNKEAIKKRIELYKKETAPLIKFYEEKEKLKRINANPTIEETTPKIKLALNS